MTKNNRYWQLFALIVFISGIAGLSYELIWIRSIKGYFGSEIFSITMVVTLYFVGLGLGGVIGSRLLKLNYSPIRIYALLESLVGLFSIFFPILIIAVQKSYFYFTAFCSPDYWIVLKAIHAGVLLFIPTTLIGITLPVIAAIVVYKPEVFTKRFSLFYGLNTFGAVAGCILVGLVLIPNIGLTWTGRAIASLNFTVAALCWFSREKFLPVTETIVYKKQKFNQALFPCLIAFFMGFLALCYEIVWIRIFSFYFITTTISLAVLLSIYLVGLALGSLLLSFLKRQVSVFQLGILELGKAVFMVVSFLLIRYVFFSNWDSIMTTIKNDNNLWQLLHYYILFGALAFLVPGIIMGMTFPLIERVWPSEKGGTGHVTGILTAWNTWGGAIGSLVAGLVLISFIGTTNTLFISIIISCILSLSLFVYTKKITLSLLPLAMIVVIIFVLPREMNLKRKPDNIANYEFYKEGRVGSVAVLKNKFGVKTLELDNTYVLGGTGIKAVRVQENQGTLPIILHASKSNKVLKIGEGTGITSLASVESMTTKQMDIVEIVPEVITTLPLFSDYNHNLLQNPVVKMHEGDGREFLALSKEKYDVIIGELYTPQMAGTANLYSIEHFKSIKNHLAPKGLYCQWLQLSQFSPEMFKIVTNTFLKVFGKGTLWLASTNHVMPLVALIYTENELWDINEISSGLGQYPKDYLKYIGFTDPKDVMINFITDRLEDLTLGEKRINTIDNPWIEEIAARTLANAQASPINWFLYNRHWPEKWDTLQLEKEYWNKYWSLWETNLEIFEKNKFDQVTYNKLINKLDSLPNTSSFNLFKAEIIGGVTEEVLFKYKLFNDKNEQYKYISRFYANTVILDPVNYDYHKNLIFIYKLLNDKDKVQYHTAEFWNLLPDNLKKEKVYEKYKPQIQ
jgi:spermidine synthase